MAANTLGAGLLIVQALLLAHLIAGAVFARGLPAHAGVSLTILFAVFVARAATVYIGERAAANAALRVKRGVRDALVERLHALGPAWLEDRSPGELATVLVEGVEALEGYYAKYLPQAALALVVPAAILAVVFPIDWISGVILAGTAPLIPVSMVLIGKGAQALNERQWRRLTRLSAHFFEILAGIATLKAFGASRAQAGIVERLSEDYRQGTMSVLRVAFLSSLALEFLATMSIAMVAVLVGFRLLWGDIAFAAGLAALLLAPEFYLPLRDLGQAYHARLAAAAAAAKIGAILAASPPQRSGHRRYRPGPAVRVDFEEVNFAYAGGDDVLRGISFSIPAGGHWAIVGASGAGKSTLLSLLMGFASPAGGRILVDGQPLSELRAEDWRSALAWVPQRPHLFAGTVADNIRLGRPGASDPEVRAAAADALAAEFIEALPFGYETPVGEDGAGLSGGEIQRIALARAFLRNAPLVVLDEPTASLDAESEAAVTRGLHRLASGRTLVGVAHRLQTVRDADRIVVLEGGRIAASGDHDALLAGSAAYRELVAAAPAAERNDP